MDGVIGMEQITLRGTYSEMGAELGKLLRANNYQPPPVAGDRIEMAKGCEQALEEHAPTLLEELNAMIEAGRFEKTTLKTFELGLNPYPVFGCSIFAISGEHTTSGNMIFARNYDWNWSFIDFLMLVRNYPKGRLASLSLSDIIIGRYGGINEAGLAIGLTAIPGYHKKDQPGVMLHLATRWVLDNCKTVKEAVDFMESIPHVRGNNYLVLDKSGETALIQACPEKVVVLQPEDGLVVATNHFQSPEMQVFEEKPKIPVSSVSRYQTIRDWMRKQDGKVGHKQAQQVLKGRHAQGAGVCQDYIKDDVRFGTIWAWTHEAGTRSFELADACPADVDFETYTF
ncbi:MAG: linear amide C-N hydrolase [Candidatus Thorarchaeota archaeon]|nr:MAG: linear amide C-N hydrolase [Candidatus Thorarchaeota archaeon]